MEGIPCFHWSAGRGTRGTDWPIIVDVVEVHYWVCRFRSAERGLAVCVLVLEQCRRVNWPVQSDGAGEQPWRGYLGRTEQASLLSVAVGEGRLRVPPQRR